VGSHAKQALVHPPRRRIPSRLRPVGPTPSTFRIQTLRTRGANLILATRLSDTTSLSNPRASLSPLSLRGFGKAAAILAPRIPPVRQLWISLAILGSVGSWLLGGLGTFNLVVLPLVASVVDLGIQRWRFSRPRVPDTAIASALFIALLLPPTFSGFLAVVVTISAILLRHALRSRGHPWENPAALGIVLASLAFHALPAWWVAVAPWEEALLGLLGGLLLLRHRRRVIASVSFFGFFALLTTVEYVARFSLTGQPLSAGVLELSVLDPVILFFGLFMVPEPRTSPVRPLAQLLYGLGVATGTVYLTVLTPTLAPLISILTLNMVTMGGRLLSASASTGPQPRGAGARRNLRAARSRPVPWSASTRAVVAILTLAILTGVAVGYVPFSPAPSVLGGLPGGGGPGSSTPSLTNCQSDNPSIPAPTLNSLHQLLGPSVILSYDANTGVVIFYDPVHHVTVTETDLYEDFGYAEFNGDDFVQDGCVLP
jgi:Na+-translocating ferredoxin:NAD+ oxidoreductase RnfD subunit